MAIHIISNNQPRWTIQGYELSDEEAKEFDYLEGDRLHESTFFRYRGQLYDLGEAVLTPNSAEFKDWDGYYNETIFSGVLVKIVDGGDAVIVGRYYS